MNANDFIEAWGRHHFDQCLNSISRMTGDEIKSLSDNIMPENMECLSSPFFFIRQMTSTQALAYTKLLTHKFDNPAGVFNGSSPRIGKACSRLSLCVPEFMEAAYLRGDRASLEGMFRAYTMAIECLEKQVDRDGPGLIERGMAERWAEALSYTFRLIDEVQPSTIAFINKAIGLRGDKIASTMIYALRQKASHAPAGQRPGQFAEGLGRLLGVMEGTDLLIVPQDVDSLIKEVDNLPSYYLETDQGCLWAVRDSFLKHLLDPGRGGKWLGNTFARSGRKPLDVDKIVRLGRSIDTLLGKPESRLASEALWIHKVGLINAISRHVGSQSILENAMVTLVKDCSDDQIRHILQTVTPKAAVILAKGIGRRLPERLSVVSSRLGEKIFVVDLGL